MKLSFSFPSEVPGALIDLKKGRSTISFTQGELEFALRLFTLISFETNNADPAPPPAVPSTDQDTTPILD